MTKTMNERSIGAARSREPGAESAAEEAVSCSELYERFGDEIFGFLIGLLRRRAWAEDVLQETFVKVLGKAEGLAEVENPRAWLFAIARRAAIDLLRRERGQPATRRELEESSARLAAAVDPDRGWRGLAARERRQIVHEELGALSPEQRSILMLFTRGLSFREIARVLDCTHPTAKSRFVKATTALTRGLWKRRIFKEGDL